MKNPLLLLLPLIFILCFNCVASASREISGAQTVSDTPDRILVNQVGYHPHSDKIALIRVKTAKFEVIDVNSGKVVFTGKPGPFKYWDQSGDSVCAADFSAVTIPGKYQICLKDNSVCSYVFEIGRDVYTDVAKASLKAFYLNRSGIEITKEFGGKWARPAGHPDTEVIVHASASSEKRPEGTIISSAGGWYDAGDYNKYIVNSGISTYTLLLFCQMYPEFCKNFNGNIPESNNAIPDVMDELLVNLRWMLTMQDPDDGGVYHKLTNKKFCDFVMPDKATDPRYVVLKSTAASLDFTATMAMASRVLTQSDSKELVFLGKTCLEAAQKSYAWANANPAVYFKNPTDISTGAYDDMELSDEFFWAATELGLAKNDMMLISQKEIQAQKTRVPSWDYSGMTGIISLSLSDLPKATNHKTEAQKILLDYADMLVAVSENSAYKVSLDFFKWGSNSDVVNQALIKLVAYKVSGDEKYLASVQGDVDYILGRNATGYCFVTGFGSRQVMNIHHRPSGSDGITDPYPGFLAGGPNTVVLNDCPEINRSTFPAKSYADAECSYSTNEVAINWNAPLFFVLSAMDLHSQNDKIK
ncbi:MAG: glycoside hydrolase family 9 protein [Bacteroidales bacterium]|nr:glycoside hydrolase family 9 protein [Bacteroidales bacterium]